jgi:hypothetical protein
MWRWGLWVWCLCACAPSSYPRLSEVATPGGARVYLATNVAHATGTARVLSPAQVQAGHPGARVKANVAPLHLGDSQALVFFAPLWIEAQAAVGVFEPCELGASFSLLRITGELRCAVVRPADGSLGVALGAAAMHHTLFGSDAGTLNFPWRATLELSADADSYTPVLNVVLSHGPTQRWLTDDGVVADPDKEYGHVGSYGLFVVRDEWKLAFPVGYHFPFASSRGGVIVGVVPEWTFASANFRTQCDDCLSVANRFEQSWAVFGTIALTATD